MIANFASIALALDTSSFSALNLSVVPARPVCKILRILPGLDNQMLDGLNGLDQVGLRHSLKLADHFSLRKSVCGFSAYGTR